MLITIIKKPNAKRLTPNADSGVATLPTVIALAVLILVVGAGITASALSESFISLGHKKSVRGADFRGGRSAGRPCAHRPQQKIRLRDDRLLPD